MTKIKICGLKSSDDIQMVNELKPDYCGFIIDFPKSHRSKTPEEVANLVKELDKENVIPVGVFVDDDIETVAKLVNNGIIYMVQLHGNEDEHYIDELRNLITDDRKVYISSTFKGIIKAFQIKNESDFDKALQSSADYVLLDQGQGCGETFDWSLIRKDEVNRPWFLAGGLNDENIVNAIDRFSPNVVDLSSAVETDKKKDYAKVKNMISLVRGVGQI